MAGEALEAQAKATHEKCFAEAFHAFPQLVRLLDSLFRLEPLRVVLAAEELDVLLHRPEQMVFRDDVLRQVDELRQSQIHLISVSVHALCSAHPKIARGSCH
jgi:transposase